MMPCLSPSRILWPMAQCLAEMCSPSNAMRGHHAQYPIAQTIPVPTVLCNHKGWNVVYLCIAFLSYNGSMCGCCASPLAAQVARSTGWSIPEVDFQKVTTDVRVLIVAEHASALFGGEAMLPLQYFKHLKNRGVDVNMILHERCKNSMDAEFGVDHPNIHYVKDSLINILCYKIGIRLPKFISEFSVGVISHWDTQIRQRRVVRRIVREMDIQVVHEPIPVSPKMPSFMFDVGVPVIVGPMNGGMDFPANYRPLFDVSGTFVKVMRLTSSIMNILVPGKRRAHVLLVANERSKKALPSSVYPERARVLVENGVDYAVFREPLKRGSQASSAIRIAYAGAIIGWKRVDLLIKACIAIKAEHDFVLDIFGNGVLMGEMKALSEPLGSRVVFHGYVDQATLAERMAAVDIFVLPSMRECGGAVILEAMALGIPVIATNWGGPADYVTEKCGFLIDPVQESAFVDELSKSIERLILDPSLRRSMGDAGVRRIRSVFNWDTKIDDIIDIYEEVALSTEEAMATV